MFGRKRKLHDFSAEIRAHLELETERLQEQGLSYQEARAAASRVFGNVASAQERFYESGRWVWWDQFWQDLRFALRVLRKSSGFTLVAVLTLALGIGATTAIFSVVNAVLLQALPYRDPNRLMLVREKLPKFSSRAVGVSAPDISVMAGENRVFTAVGAFTTRHLNLSGAGAPQRVISARTSASLFPVLDAAPLLGRTFQDGEDQPGHFVVVISYALWQERFGGDAGAVGRSVRLDGQPYTVIGVMPPSFEFPPRGLPAYQPADLWTPMALTPEELSDLGDNFDWGVIGRLKPGVTLTQAQSDMKVVAADVLRTWHVPPSENFELDVLVTPFREVVIRNVRMLMYLLLGAVGLLLLIACANVANLLLARTSARRREMAMRAALGAARGRVIRQLLTESVLLAVSGGALGVLAALWGTRLLAALAPGNIPQVQGIAVDRTVLLFAALLSLVTGVLFGLAPALAGSRADVNDTLKEAGREGAPSGASARRIFVIAQVAITFVLVMGGGLLVRSFIGARNSDSGVQAENVVTATFSLPPTEYSQSQRAGQFFRRLAQRMENTPGVESIGFSSDLPTEMDWDHIFVVEERPAQEKGHPPQSANSMVLGNYFQAVGVPLIRGRFFTPQEEQGHADVLIISAGMARQYWPGEDPIGKRVKWGTPDTKTPWLTVIGVVGDVKQDALDQPVLAHTYEPYLWVCSQKDAMQNSICDTLNVAVRSRMAPAAVLAALQHAVRDIDPAQPLTRVRTLREVLQSSIAPRRFNTFLLAIFACAALLLSSIGLYGVISYSVGQRTREIGVRLALGAQPGAILRITLGQGLKLLAIGVTVGLAASLALTRLMATLLYDVSATDPLTFLAVAALLGFVALFACYIPARRAMRVDPVVALRYE